MQDLLIERWGSNVVTGDIKPVKPCMIPFKNTVEALKLLRKHIARNSRIVVHCDVDLDGVGCGYILRKFLKSQGAISVQFMINKEKVHGVAQKHVDYFNQNKIDLLIIVDSSSNEIETIQKFDCDVLVIDHHEINHNDTYIKNEHEYVIINNMISNLNCESINEWIKKHNVNTDVILEPYEQEERMSGALVLYELLRVYCETYKTGPVLENMMLYQWVGLTLFSDSVLLANDRNQWYIDKTVHSMEVEPSIQIMMQQINDYKATLDKSFITYTLVPIINKAIRAGASSEALDIILYRPNNIKNLDKYKEAQANALAMAIDKKIKYTSDYAMNDITGKGISKNYCGVIASRICGDNSKNTVVFILQDNIATGSFRGVYSNVDYRRYFESYDESVFAQGHKAAFGFKATVEQLKDILSNLHSIETKDRGVYLSAGNVDEKHLGKYHIDDMLKFKQEALLWRLAIGNSNVSSEEQIEILTGIDSVDFKEQRGSIYIYDVLGLECKAFEPIVTRYVTVYAEFSNQVDIYVRNYNKG